MPTLPRPVWRDKQDRQHLLAGSRGFVAARRAPNRFSLRRCGIILCLWHRSDPHICRLRIFADILVFTALWELLLNNPEIGLVASRRSVFDPRRRGGARRVNFETTNPAAWEDRPIDTLLASYAARTTNAAVTALVAGHLEIKPDNRAYVAALEIAQGVFLAECDAVPLTGRDRRLVNIFASRKVEDVLRPARAPSVCDHEPFLPVAIRRFAGRDYGDLHWRTIASGIERSLITEGDFGRAYFLRCRAGSWLPAHGHSGAEILLVLAGYFSDIDGFYRRGDMRLAMPNNSRAPLIAGGEDCACFVVSEEKARHRRSIGRFFGQVFGR